MRERSVIRNLLLISALIAASGCAKMNSPSGGPRDRTAPVIVRSEPENGTVNFNEKEITITFNEYVVLDKINEKFMVSPPMNLKPRVFTRGKSVRIGFDEELRDSVTYTFYFQDAIRDLNEGNAINNYQFVFSTGPFVDSLSVTGNVYTAFSLDPPENTLVMLYTHQEDSSVIKQIPDYITRVEPNGEFRIDNVHQGIYRLYALKDGDNSKNYNRRDEDFAFYDTLVKITPEKNFLPVKKDTAVVAVKSADDKAPVKSAVGNVAAKSADGKVVKPPVIGEYQLVLFQAEKKARYLTSSSRKLPYQLKYTLSLPPDSIKFGFLIPGVNNNSYFLENSVNHDTITVWLTDSTVYNRNQLETIIQFPFTDSLGITASKTDTIIMRYAAPRAPRSKIVKRTPYSVNTGNLTGQVRPDKKIAFTGATPFKLVDTSRIRFYEVLKEKRIIMPYSVYKDTSNSCRYYVKTDLKPGNNYLFIADSAAFTNIYGDYSDSTGTRFSVMTPDLFGKLFFDITNSGGSTIIQLLDNSEKLKREAFMEGGGRLEFQLLEKGLYRAKAIFDLNGDRKWTTGDFDIHRQPEPVYYFDKEIEIKENWDDVEKWNLEMKNVKNSKLQKIKAAR